MPEKDLPNTRKPRPLWAFLSSVRLTVVLLALLVLLAVLGTVIPQRDTAMEAARHAHTGWAAVVDALRLSDVFHSPWLHALLGLLSLNLVVCSLNRFPASLRAFRGDSFTDPSVPPGNLPPTLSLETGDRPEEALKRMEDLLKKTYRLAGRRTRAETDFLYADRGRYSRFGVYVIHLGVLVIIAGALAGSLFGFKAYVNLVEGESSDVAYLRGGEEQKKFDFAVRCDRFSVDFYESGAPKEYRSDLTFLKGGRVAHQGFLRVNSPILFEGFRFYQASYGIAPGGRISLGFRRGAGKEQSVNIGAGEAVELPEAGARVRVARIVENMMEMGPAVKLVVETPKGQVAFWVFQEIAEIERANPGIVRQVPMFNPGLFAPYVFSLDRLERKYYTGLQVARDPGAPVVAAGAFLLFAGLMAVFFSSHRQIEVRVGTSGGRTQIGISGRSSRDPRGLQEEMRRILGGYTKASL
ncbi:MAG: Cytochrome c biogenesis protein CcsB [Syntrophaceae bacterium PtaU1.Bin231]|nr:MAG: Cytochrome c biogenesis protein CcsB [Syntrophaceae bacterium PtaU1.Bin231]